MALTAVSLGSQSVIISRFRTSWILTPLDSKWSVWIVLVVPLSLLSPSFFWWRLEKILKWLCFVHLRGWRKADYKWMCNWKSSWDKEEIYTDATEEFFMEALCCNRIWGWSCAWPALARGGPRLWWNVFRKANSEVQTLKTLLKCSLAPSGFSFGIVIKEMNYLGII